MAIPNGVILLWAGTHAGIPSGWTRETTLDDKFPKATADGTNPDVIGGSDTHTHTSTAHSHAMVAHNHSVSSNQDTASEDDTDSTNSSGIEHHTHTGTTNTVTSGSISDAISYQAASTLPPYYTVIFIKPSGTVGSISAGIIGFVGSSTIPTNWAFCDGTGSTPNLLNKYLRGASVGADAGGTGGATSHSHTVDHTHTAVNHSHTGTSGGGSGSGHNIGNPAGSNPFGSHTHGITLYNQSVATSTYTGTAGSAETVEPAYKKLNPIRSSATSTPKGLVGLWLGTLVNIPNGWVLCDGNNDTLDLRDKFIKCADIAANIGGTGGGNSHSHAASNSHNHTASASHSHTGSFASNDDNNGPQPTGGNYVIKNPHGHNMASCDSQTSTYGNITIAAENSSNEPAYRTVAYIQLNKTRKGAGLLTMLL